MIGRAATSLAAAAVVTLGGGLYTASSASDPTAPGAQDIQTLQAAGINPAELTPGWSIQGDEVVWNGGDVSASLAAAGGYDDCASGYVCFYADKDYNGRRLQFRDVGLRGDMRDWSFNDQMSSWRSRRGLDARWYYDYNGSGTSRCTESISSNSDVGAGIWNTDNDEMSSFRIYSNDTSC